MHLKYNLWTTYKNCHCLLIIEFADPKIMICFLLFRNANLRLTSLTLWCLRSPESPISVTEDPPPLQVVILQRLRTKNPHPRPLAQDPLFTLPLSQGSSSNSPSTPEGRGSQDLPLDQSSICGNSSESYAPRGHTPSQPLSTTSPLSLSTCTVSTTTITSTSSGHRVSFAASPTASRDDNGSKKPKKSKKHKDKERKREGERERDKDKDRKRDREHHREDPSDKEAQPMKKHCNEAEQRHIPANISHESDREGLFCHVLCILWC